jgi:dihydrofolate reductase
MISVVVGGDRFPCSVSYCILVHGSKTWTLVTAEHNKSAEDLHDCLVLFPSRARNPLDSEFRVSGDVEVVQQHPQPAGGDRGFISGGLDLIGVAECLFNTKLITRPRGLHSGTKHHTTGRRPGARTPRRSLHQRILHLLSRRP